MIDDQVVTYPHQYCVSINPHETLQDMDMKLKTNSSYGKPTIYRPDTDFLINPTTVKHEAYGDISNESASYFFKVTCGI